MSQPPAKPPIYHITHVKNLKSIVDDKFLWSDQVLIDRGGGNESIGMGSIKEMRLETPVKCHTDLNVGDCVPFYYCPRSVMLFIIYRANHPKLTYRGGQGPILHLEADLDRAIEWANDDERKWAISLSNASGTYAEFRKNRRRLDEISWEAVRATDFRDPDIQEGKQAEFLVYEKFPWKLIDRIGVSSPAVQEQVLKILYTAKHKPIVEVRRDWYF